MSRIIDSIKLKNFKAFQEEEFAINGKNILIYGNNGSGKSSLFWALYTIVQSSVKQNEEVEKYFKVFDESDQDTHQSLRNIFMDSSEDAYIEVITNNEDDNEETYRISQNTIDTNKDEDTTIQELNLASDFINHKLLHNFYNATHRQAINLWPVFERDIFPFLTTDEGGIWIDRIKNLTDDIPRDSRGYEAQKNSSKRKLYETKLNQLNSDIEALLDQIQRNANDLIKTQFYDGKELIKISLSFDEEFAFGKVKKGLWDNSSYGSEQLKIKLLIKIKDESTGQYKSVLRPHSFLHESMLTRIAIAIRIGALRTRVQTTAFKVLVLDDMLISLDMSNRMDVIEMVLNEENKTQLEFFDEFQKIILTHDKGFYELVKRRTSPLEWKYYKMNNDEKNNTPPFINEDRNRIKKAEDYLAEGDLESCGHELRKETEILMDRYLKALNNAAISGEYEPLMEKINKLQNTLDARDKWFFQRLFVKDIPVEVLKKIKTDFENDEDLDQEIKGRLRGLKNDLLNYLINKYEQNNQLEEILSDVKDAVKRIMNPASHSNFVPLYQKELKKAIEGVKKLKEILNKDELDNYLSVEVENN